MKKYLYYAFLYLNKKTRLGTKASSGRNFLGKICVHHQVGGLKSKYIFIDFYRRLNNFGYIYKVLCDSFRTALIGGVIYENGLFSYIILTENLVKGSKVYSGSSVFLDKIGSTSLLINIKLFTIISNIELYANLGSCLVRSAGSSAILTALYNNKVMLKLKSGWLLLLNNKSLASLGIISNMKHKFTNLKLAGKSKSLGRRPSVRGVSMNPCDHPHGGGEGKKSPLPSQKSPWGWLTKGTPTLKKKYKIKKKKIII